MRYLKMLGLAAIAAAALTALAVGSASATTLEVGGATNNSSVNIETSLHEVHIVFARTDGSLANECLTMNLAGNTETFTGTTVTGAIDSLAISSCSRPTVVHKAGTLHIAHITGSTNGTVSWSGAEVTVGSPFGTLNCKTGAGAHLGTLTGTASGHAQIDFNLAAACGFLAPSVTWKGTLDVTSPTGLGVSA